MGQLNQISSSLLATHAMPCPDQNLECTQRVNGYFFRSWSPVQQISNHGSIYARYGACTNEPTWKNGTSFSKSCVTLSLIHRTNVTDKVVCYGYLPNFSLEQEKFPLGMFRSQSNLSQPWNVLQPLASNKQPCCQSLCFSSFTCYLAGAMVVCLTSSSCLCSHLPMVKNS